MGAGYRPVFLNELVNVMITLGDVSVRDEALVGVGECSPARSLWVTATASVAARHGYIGKIIV